MPNSQTGLRLYTQKLEEEIDRFANKVAVCNLTFITDHIITINSFLGELKKADQFAVLPEDLEKKYRELRIKYDTYKEILENDCECVKKK